MTDPAPASPQAWADAVLAAALLAIDPIGLGGIRLRARAGPVRDRWLDHLAGCLPPDASMKRIAAGIADSRLTGGLDVGLTLERGAPVVERGVLAGADGGVVVLAMAERLSASSAGIIAAAMDGGFVRLERDGLSLRHPARFALVALDEGIDDERPPAALADRLGLTVEIDAVALRDATDASLRPDLAPMRAALASVALPDELAAALVAAALAAGADSMRASLFLCRTARAHAAWRGADIVAVEDVVTALRLVLSISIGAPEEEPAANPDQPDATEPPRDEQGEDDAMSREMTADMIVEAVKASLPKGLLGDAEPGRARGRQEGGGRSGEPRRAAGRGRAVGVTDRPPAPGARLDVLSTLRQAAPWQRIRRNAASPALAGSTVSRLIVRKQDFRYIRHREKAGTTAIFAVDASGSAAYERLAETKGAVELLLADCYVRRDSVAMIAFRGMGAEILLEPTRSLVRARRCLSALPGGGGTPLAAGVLATLAMADGASRKGQQVVAVFLTDGRGNVGLDGATGREAVADEIGRAAMRFRRSGVRAILIDTARRPQARAETLARDLGAEYIALPFGDAATIAREIGERMEA